jgi:PTS system nitrogen regulatory IIA component
MQPADLLTPERVVYATGVASKKRALEQLSTLLAKGEPSLTPTQIFDSLLARERLGSTGLGRGVAIPHGRMKQGEQAVGAFVKLAQGIDFDAADRQPVGMLFALLVPEQATEEHLQLLAQLARMFSDAGLVAKLQASDDAAMLYETIRSWQPSD